MSCKEMLIGDLKARRESLGWSVGEVADRAGLDEAVIAQCELGDASVPLEAVESWAGALGLTLSLMPAEGEARRGLKVDWEARRVSVDGTAVRLTPMEWKALERLAAAPGELVPHLDLFRHLYGENEPYRAQSTAIRVLITKLRRLLPPLRIEAQWGRGYVISGIAASSPRGTPQGEAVGEPPAAEPVAPQPEKRFEPVAMSPSSIVLERAAISRKLVQISHSEVRRSATATVRPNPCRADELTSIERFLTERGVTRCPDVATIQHAPLPTLVWDKMKRKWVRPPTVTREAS
jgi:DNA-binding winged helix-turn-helix (wHTH) protein